MQNIINDQEMIIDDLRHFKIKTIDELEDFKTQVILKTDQLNEWKHKYEVNFK